ncbi:TetR/AcrR family transcriptional regulator [Actinomadura macrotermitis]|uniref:HTH tetR-type domain-containing protein n=1 Tax=Actinomadura macrotermitis TaxID=2585200 RepID=A0A7K0BN16_9ACTN|nr:TetR/AcrR family transcriptional regulator [Actinomadura macrotermitis]MQY02565.1 hypothetical protein [Actinomadura macrotermitis]
MTDSMTTRPPGRPRSERAEKAIVDATLELLAEETGVAGVSIEAVATRAGVGKTTIYRRWPNKEALIVGALATAKAPVPPPVGASAREDLLMVARALAAGRRGPHGRCFHSLLGSAEKYPELFARYRQDVIEPRREMMRAALRLGIERGELRPDLDLDVTLAMLIGAFGMPASQEALPPDYPERVVDALLRGIAL